MIKFIFLIFIFLYTNYIIASYKVTSVIAIGNGLSKQEALHDAMKKAIIKAVGAYVSTKTTSYNNKLDEKIIILSDANISDYTEIKSFKHDDIWIVKIKANILPNELIKYQPKLITQKISDTELGNLVIKENSLQNAKDILSEIFKDYNLRLYKFKKQNITVTDTNDKEVELQLSFNAYLDQLEYNKFQDNICAVLNKIAFQKIKYRIKNNESIPKGFAENLFKKTGEHTFDHNKYAFIAFKNFKKYYTDYHLFLIPRSIFNHIIQNIYAYHNKYTPYLVCSLMLSGTAETHKNFIELTSLNCMEFARPYSNASGDYKFIIGRTLIRPLTFMNKIKIQKRSWDNGTIIEKNNSFCFRTKGKITIYCPKKDLKKIKEIYLYTIESTNSGKNYLLKSAKQIEEKFWHCK